jgi:phytoene synthase
MRTSSDLSDLYREAAAATAAGSKSFYFCTRFFPTDLARSAHAVYWFCRTTDDIVDEAECPREARVKLGEWESAVHDGYRGIAPESPILKAFFDAARRHSIPAEYPLELIAGCRMDLERVRYKTFDELRVFCYRVASTVGLMMSKVIGFRDPSLEERGLRHAVELGIAMQLTNILRDVGEDLGMERIYLPQEEMAEFGYTETKLRASAVDDAFVRLIEYQMSRARSFYAAAEPGIAMLHPRGAFSVRLASDVYRGILAEIARNRYDVFSKRAVVPASRKYQLMAGALAGRYAFWRS